MGNLYYTLGRPRSGKSTICTNWAKAAPMRTIVNSDSIRLALTGQRYEPLAETMVFAIKHVMIRSLLARGFDVVVDGTHSTEISIQRILEIDINAKHIIVDTPKEECIKRAISTNQEDLIPIIERIDNNLKNILCHPNTLQYTIGKIWQPTDAYFQFYPNLDYTMLPYYPSFEINTLNKIRDKIKERGLYGKSN